MKKLSNTHTHHHLPLTAIVLFIGIIIGISSSMLAFKVFAHGGDLNQIHACVKNNKGTLRIVDANAACDKDETSLDWNIQGPPGPPGSGGSSGLPFFCIECFLTPYADKFAGKDYSGAQIRYSGFSGADLSGVIFKGGMIDDTEFIGTNLTGADFSNLQPLYPRSYGIGNNNFSNANMTNANFSDSKFGYRCNFSGANLQNTNFSNTSFSGVNFAGAQNMSTANLAGTTWNDVTCPDGSNSNNNGNTCAGHF